MTEQKLVSGAAASAITEQKERANFRLMKRRADAARDFPNNTDPCSRHVYLMAEGLARRGYPMLQEEPMHCAVSLMATVALLWEERNLLAKARILMERAIEPISIVIDEQAPEA